MRLTSHPDEDVCAAAAAAMVATLKP